MNSGIVPSFGLCRTPFVRTTPTLGGGRLEWRLIEVGALGCAGWSRTKPCEAFCEVGERAESGQLGRLLEHTLITAVLKLDHVCQDDGPGPGIDVSISAAARQPFGEETDRLGRILRGMKQSEAAQGERLVTRVADLGRIGDGLGEAMRSGASIMTRESAIGEHEHGPGQDRAPPAPTYVIQAGLSHGRTAGRIARAFDRTGQHGLRVSLPASLLGVAEPSDGRR